MADFRDVDDKLMTTKRVDEVLGWVCMRKCIYRSREAVLKFKTGY